MSKKLDLSKIDSKDSAEFRPVLARTLIFEGGYSEADGQPTNYGVRQNVYNSWNLQKGYKPKSVKELNAGDVYRFYNDEFYNRPKYNKLPNEIKFNVFDFGVNAGTDAATKTLQRIVGANPDGKIGKETLGKVSNYMKKNGDRKLNLELLNKRQVYYNDLAARRADKRDFLPGWTNRVNAIKRDYDVNG